MPLPELRVITPGPLASIQDRGRFGLRRVGIPWAGTLVPAWQSIANAMVGNPLAYPVIECFESGLSLHVAEGPVSIGLAGDTTCDLIEDKAEPRRLANWQSHVLRPGQRLLVRSTGLVRCALISIRGFAARQHQGSASTYARAGLGGLNGQTLQAGDSLIAGTHTDECRGLSAYDAQAALALVLPGTDTTLDVMAMPGPQADAFSTEQLERMFTMHWRIGTETDRMGVRLDGALIKHRDPAARDIVSDAILPGAIQVPGNGRPILMLADAATVGGYPKIATLVSSDLAGIALARPGTSIRITRCDSRQAIARVRDAASQVERLVAAVGELSTTPDTDRLLQTNLIDGVVNATDD